MHVHSLEVARVVWTATSSRIDSSPLGFLFAEHFESLLHPLTSRVVHGEPGLVHLVPLQNPTHLYIGVSVTLFGDGERGRSRDHWVT